MPLFSRRRAFEPKLVQAILPPYEIPELIVVGGVIVENRGHAPAHNVKIVLEFDNPVAKIRHLQVAGDCEYIVRGGGDMESFATLRLRQLGPGKRVVVYYSGPDSAQPKVTVTHYEG